MAHPGSSTSKALLSHLAASHRYIPASPWVLDPPLQTDGLIFARFMELPGEIQKMVWKAAVPDPRDVPNAIVVFVNFDLENPKAILPNPTEYRRLHERILPHQGGKFGLPAYEDGFSMVTSPVLSLLHSCHEGRSAVLDTYRLDMEGISGAETSPLWAPEDSLFVTASRSMSLQIINVWLSKSPVSRWSYTGFHSARYVALQLKCGSLGTLGFGNGNDPRFTNHLPLLLGSLPALKNLTLVVDRERTIHRDKGRISLYTGEDVEIPELGVLKPSEVEKIVTKAIKNSRVRRKKMPSVHVQFTSWEMHPIPETRMEPIILD